MRFFRQSFENFGETLRTVGLVIGLLTTSITGVGYIYTMISDQKALAVGVDNVSKRVSVLETEVTKWTLDRHRIAATEEGTRALNLKVDRILEILALRGTEPKEGRF